ncbi:YqjF family protein [Salana multivorans]
MVTAVEPVSIIPPPLPGPALHREQWRSATFVHWAVDPGRVAPMLPPGIRPDVRDGQTFVGLVAFEMADVGLLRGPALPPFPETNVRLYSVDAAGRRGIVFLSLDADQRLVVAAARVWLGLNYRAARMTLQADGTLRRYTTRLRRGGVAGALTVEVGPARLEDDLVAFLTARWRLHTHHLGHTWFVQNRHDPWPVRAASLVSLEGNLLASVGLPELDGRAPDHVAYSPGVRVRFGGAFPALPAAPVRRGSRRRRS